jgi:hypothetical protein
MENITAWLAHFKTSQTPAVTCGYFLVIPIKKKKKWRIYVSLFAVTLHRKMVEISILFRLKKSGLTMGSL